MLQRWDSGRPGARQVALLTRCVREAYSRSVRSAPPGRAGSSGGERGGTGEDRVRGSMSYQSRFCLRTQSRSPASSLPDGDCLLAPWKLLSRPPNSREALEGADRTNPPARLFEISKISTEIGHERGLPGGR